MQPADLVRLARSRRGLRLFATSAVHRRVFDYAHFFGHFDGYKRAAIDKNLPCDLSSDKLFSVYEKHRSLIHQREACALDLERAKTELGRLNAQLKQSKDSELALQKKTLIQTFSEIHTRDKSLAHEQSELAHQLDDFIDTYPNLIHPLAPTGGEDMNREIYNTLWDPRAVKFAEARRRISKTMPDPYSYPSILGVSPDSNLPLQTPKKNKMGLDHERVVDAYYIAQEYGMFDFYTSSFASGPGFMYGLNLGARLEHALVSYSMDFFAQLGYCLMFPPDVVGEPVLLGSGFRPRVPDSLKAKLEAHGEKVEADLSRQIYFLEGDLPFRKVLAGTSELTINGFLKDKLYPEKYINDVRILAVSHCFRSETVGDNNKNRGLYRLHQFTKAELFHLSSADTLEINGRTVSQSDQVHIELLQNQVSFLVSLGLDFRVLEMASMELGVPAHRKFDIEAWLPSRKSYGEVSSTSNCTDYQSRRLNLRYRLHGPSHSPCVHSHTLNGTACAVPRIMLALIEQYQAADGSIHIPTVLHPYMNGITTIPKPDISLISHNEQYAYKPHEAVFSYINKERLLPKELRPKTHWRTV